MTSPMPNCPCLARRRGAVRQPSPPRPGRLAAGEPAAYDTPITTECREIHADTTHRIAVDIAPGMLVRHPSQADWGIGQVQSVIGHRITVNFENAGKLLINGDLVKLEPVEDDAAPADRTAPSGDPGG